MFSTQLKEPLMPGGATGADAFRVFDMEHLERHANDLDLSLPLADVNLLNVVAVISKFVRASSCHRSLFLRIT